MDKKLKLIILPQSTKKKEFIQSLNNLSKVLVRSCKKMKIDGSEESPTINIHMDWETEDQMQRTLHSDEFTIFTGAINALCEIIEIELNNKLMANHLSILANLKKANDSKL